MSRAIVDQLAFAKQRLLLVTDVPSLEAEVLLAHVLQVSRSYLHSWPERLLDEAQEKKYSECIKRREQAEPIAYITGHREFWSLDFLVTPDVLIPRPETELLVDLILNKNLRDDAVIADLGTGSGAIALAVANERPLWTVHATDASMKALRVAKLNAARFNISNVCFHQGEWCAALPNIKFNAIVSNPPYIAEDDLHLKERELCFEPRSALVSAKDGLQDIEQIIFDGRNYLQSDGCLLLEHGYQQGKKVARIFEKAGYTHVDIHHDVAGLERVTIACWPGF